MAASDMGHNEREADDELAVKLPEAPNGAVLAGERAINFIDI